LPVCAHDALARSRQTKITEALINALREVLTGPVLAEAFAKAFERRVNARSKDDKPADLARNLDAARRRVSNATKLMIEMPDDLDIRRQREHDKTEVHAPRSIGSWMSWPARTPRADVRSSPSSCLSR